MFSHHLSHHDLGMIPDWQFSQDRRINPYWNPYMKFPPGMTQRTIQPIDKGFGSVFDSWGWRNRKWIALGVLALLGAGAVAALK